MLDSPSSDFSPSPTDSSDPAPEGASLEEALQSAAFAAPTAADPASLALATMQAAFPTTFASSAVATLSATAGPFTIAGGKAASSATAKDGDYFYDSTQKTLHILTSTPLTLSTAAQTDSNIEIDAGVKADLTLDNVNILTPSASTNAPINLVTNVMDTADGSRAKHADDILNKTMLHLTLADGSTNTLDCGNKTHAKSGAPAIRCGWGSVLVIDDAVRNLDAANNIVTPQNGAIGADVTLVGGQTLKAGDPLSRMDSANPGKLIAHGGSHSAGIGSGPQENAGTLIFNGGDIAVTASEINENGDGNNSASSGAGIGGGDGGSGTVTIFNGGVIDAQASYHGAGIGSGWGWCKYYELAKPDAIAIPTTDAESGGYSYYSGGYYYSVAGDIYINGGYIQAKGASHGNAFGRGCHGTKASNRKHIIRITGGTLLPTSASDRKDIGGLEGYTIVTGGSVNCAASKFEGVGGTAYNSLGVEDWGDVTGTYGGALPAADQVFMITIDLASEIQKRNADSKITTDTNLDDRINSWNLSVGGAPYPYGSPDRFQNGKLYLWLPKSATEKEITVDLSYTDKNGKVQKIEPLFRDPGTAQGGDLLKRYVSFDIPDSFKSSLTKYYDGTALQGLTVDEDHPIPTEDGKKLSAQSNVSYKYQLYDAVNGNPLGVESASSTTMPVNAGVMKLTIDSNQWSNTTGFKENYWGHRATGWCQILPTTSQIDLVSASWEDGKDGSVMEDGRQRLTVNATVRPGDKDPDGKPIGDHAQEPRGYIQLYVDGAEVSEPVKMVFAGDLDEDGKAIPASDPRVNATRVANGNGAYTTFKYVFIPAEKDFLVPDATADNKHEVSVRYLPPTQNDPEPANYLASTNPADDPEAPKADVVIEPVDPKTSVTSEPDPDAPEDAPEPVLTLSPTPTPTDPTAHPTGDPIYPGDKTLTGSIETVYDEPTDENPHPGRVTLKIKSESSGKISVVDDDGNPFTVDFVRGDDGEPVRGEDGTYTLILDPTAPGKGDLHIVQEPNGAFTGTHWDIDVTVRPNPKAAPETSVTKTAENLTHPDGPTQPGDRIRYTIAAANTAGGSAWLDVTLSDAIPVGLALDAATVALANPSELFDGPLAAGSPTALGEFELTTLGPDGRPILTVMAGNVYGGRGPAVLTFECTVEADATGNDIGNVAEAQGSRPDPDNPDGPNIPVDTDPTDPVSPPGGGKVVPGAPEVRSSKTVTNLTDVASKMTRVGDTLHYEITLENAGGAGTCLIGGVIADPMPVGIEPVAGTLQMTLADGSTVAVPDAAFDAASRTIAVTAGDLWGGQMVTLAFDATVTEAALGEHNENIAQIYGKVPADEPTGEKPGQPTTPPAGEPVGVTPPAEPPTLVGEDPVDGDLKVNKTAENLTRSDGTTKVGDTVRYTISVTNSGTATSWMDAAIRDDIPKGLEPMSGTLKMTLPDGTEIPVDDAAYDSAARVMSVAAGHVYGGQTVTLAFEALVVDEAVGADIGNTASAYGQPPSAWDPEGMHPMPGQPFTPGDGWAVYERTRQRIQSPTAYAPGTTSSGGVIPADDANGLLPGTGLDQSGTITGVRLAKTGDEVLRLALPIAVCATLVLATGAALGRLRRRARGE